MLRPRAFTFPFSLKDVKDVELSGFRNNSAVQPFCIKEPLKTPNLEADKFDSGMRSRRAVTPKPPEYEFPNQDDNKFSLTPTLKEVRNAFSHGSHTSVGASVIETSTERQLTVNNLSQIDSRLERLRNSDRRKSCSDLPSLRDVQNPDSSPPARSQTVQSYSMSPCKSPSSTQSTPSLILNTASLDKSEFLNHSPVDIEVSDLAVLDSKQDSGAQGKTFDTQKYRLNIDHEKCLQREMLPVKEEKLIVRQ